MRSAREICKICMEEIVDYEKHPQLSVKNFQFQKSVVNGFEWKYNLPLIGDLREVKVGN